MVPAQCAGGPSFLAVPHWRHRDQEEASESQALQPRVSTNLASATLLDLTSSRPFFANTFSESSAASRQPSAPRRTSRCQNFTSNSPSWKVLKAMSLLNRSCRHSRGGPERVLASTDFPHEAGTESPRFAAAI